MVGPTYQQMRAYCLGVGCLSTTSACNCADVGVAIYHVSQWPKTETRRTRKSSSLLSREKPWAISPWNKPAFTRFSMLGITKLSTDHDTPGENQFGRWLTNKEVRTTSPTPAPVLIGVGAGAGNSGFLRL